MCDESHDPFTQVLEAVDGIKEKLSDGEYLHILGALQRGRSATEKRTGLYKCTALQQAHRVKTSGETIVYLEPTHTLLQLSAERYKEVKVAIARFGFAEISRSPSVLYMGERYPVTIQVSRDLVVLDLKPSKPNDESPIATLL